MKRFYRILSLLIVVTLSFQTMWAGPISPEEAAEIAARFTNSQPQLSKMHKAPRKAANMRLAHKALQNNSEAAAFYVFNQENANGFVIVSADDRTAEEVLGYSEQGSFDVNTINPNLRWWLSRYAEEITALQTIDDSEFIHDGVRKAKQVEAIEPFLVNSEGKEITWYQESPYSDLCPMDERDNTRCQTGCVATAASQIMYKWAWPTKGTGTASYTWYDCMDENCNNYKTKTLTVEPGNTTYDWDNMLPAYEGKNATTAQKNAVATLMYHAGVAAKMGYGGDATGGSGAWTDDMGYGLVTYFGYKLDKFITMYSKTKYQSAKGTSAANITAEYSVTATQFENYFNEELEAGRPILMGGEGNAGGHEFVCCGRDANNKFYINWGWEGSYNGYFALTALKPGSYNFSSNLDAIIGLRPDKKDLPKVTVTWSVDGDETPEEYTQEDNLVLPANPTNCESGKVFVGWTANSSVDGSKPADLFTSAAGKIVTEAITYYAVFADADGESGGSEPVNTKYTFTSKAWADATSSWSSDKDGAGFDTTKDGVQVTASATGASASTKAEVNGVSKVVVKYCTNAKAGAGSIDIEIGSSKVSNDVTKDGGASLRDLEFDFNNASGIVKITVNCTTNSIYVNSVTITSGSGSSTTYSNYSLTCGTPCEGALTGITLNTDNVKKEFTEGDEFSYAGLVVTALYDGCDSKTVKPTSVSEPDMNKIGEQTITVTFEEESAEYKINVKALPTFAIRFFNNGVQVGETQNVKAGQAADKPADDPEACEGYTFVGWYTEALAEDNTKAPTYVTDFTATQDQDYLAVYSQTEAGEGSGTEAVEDKMTREITGSTGTSYADWSDVTISSAAVYAGNSAGGNDAIQLRSKSNAGIVTTTSGGAIKKVTVIWNSNTSGRTLDIYGSNTAYSSPADLYGSSAGTLLGSIASDSQTELEIEGSYAYVGVRSNNGALYMDAITFTWEAAGGSGSTTYYTTAPDCGAPIECELTGISLNTEKVQTEFVQGAEFSYAGLVVTAEFSNCESKTVKTFSVSEPDMNQLGEQTITVTYEEESAEYKITIQEPTKYTIAFYDNGAIIGEAQEVVEGQQPEVPADPEPECKDYTFVGWWTEPLSADNTEAKEWIADFKATQDQVYYAIFKKTEKGEGESVPVEKEYTFISKAWEDETNSWTSNKDGNQLTSGQGVQVSTGVDGAGASTNAEVNGVSKVVVNYCTNSKNGAGSIDIEIGDVKVSNDVTKTGGTTLRELEYAFDNASGIATITVNCTTNSIYVYSITIHAVSGPSSTTYYSSFENCTETAAESIETIQPAAIKALRDGQIVIIRGAEVYSITGIRIQ